MQEIEEVVIVGAGVSGLGTALGLHRKGIRCLVLEFSDSLRAAGFAILTWANAWRALDALGIGNFLRETHVLNKGLVINSATTGEVITEKIFTGEEQCLKLEARSLKRNLLLEALSKDLPPETIRFSSKVVNIEEVGKLKLLHLADGSTLKTKVLIGCDGVNSVVAKWLGLRPPAFSGRSACRGLADAPQSSINGRLIEYFFGEGFRAGIAHCNEDTLYWFFTWSPSNQAEKEAEENAQKMRELMLSKLKSSKTPKKVIEIIEKSDLSNGLVSAPLRFRWPFDLLCGNICRDNVCVAGDALHPMTPDMGQGGCAALEDAVVLARCLGEAVAARDGKKREEEEFEKVEEGLKKFAEERKWRSFALITASYLVGQIEERNGLFMRFVREKLLSGFIAWMQLKITEFDCGRL